jgi:hypothetical protein
MRHCLSVDAIFIIKLESFIDIVFYYNSSPVMGRSLHFYAYYNAPKLTARLVQEKSLLFLAERRLRNNVQGP